MKEIHIVRIYMMEAEHHLNQVLEILHEQVKVEHVVVLRGIEGFEKEGKVHASKFLSLSLDLPLVVEFFDTQEQVEKALPLLKKVIEKGHIIRLQGELA